MSSAAKSGSALDALLKAAADRSVKIGVVSALGSETMEQLAQKLGIREGTTLLAYEAEKTTSPNADTWEKLRRKLGVRPSSCLAIVTDSAACASALGAGMKCLVVCDSYTSFQDFGGADGVKESVDKGFTDEAFSLLEPGS